MFASASLLDPAWQINCSWLTLSGPRGGITLGQHYGNHSQSRDWTPSSSQPRSLTLAQVSTPTSSTTSAPQLRLKLIGTPPRRQSSLAPLSLRTLPLLLLHTVPLPPDASTQLSISDFLQRCFSKNLSRRTVPLLIQRDISGVAQRNVEFKDAATQLSFAEFFERSTLSSAQPPRHIPLPQPSDIATVNSLSSTSSNGGPIPVPRAQRDSTPPPPPGLEAQALMRISHTITSKAAPARRSLAHGPCHSPPGTQNSSPPPPALQHHVSTTQVGPHPSLFAAAPERSASTALAGTHLAISAEARAPSPCLPPYPWYVLAYASHLDTATSTMQTVISCIINTVSQCFSGTQAQHAGTPPRLSQRIVDGFMRSSNKRPVITCHMSRTTSSRTQVTRTSPSCSTGTHSIPTLQFAFHEASTSKDHVGRGSPCGSRTYVTFCSVHNVVPKKRDDSNDLLRRRHAHMAQRDVDFIGGLQHECDVFADPEFSAPGNSCGNFVPWKTQIASALGFSSCPSARMNGMWMHTATNSTTRIWHLGPVTPRPTFMFSYIYTPPTSLALTVTRAANKPSRNAWNVKLASMNVDNAAENSPTLQLPDVLVPFAGKHSGCSLRVLSWPLLW